VNGVAFTIFDLFICRQKCANRLCSLSATHAISLSFIQRAWNSNKNTNLGTGFTCSCFIIFTMAVLVAKLWQILQNLTSY